jgi:predicted PurR-regulated permease PerM
MEAMSSDGGSVREAARGLASRLRAAWGSGDAAGMADATEAAQAAQAAPGQPGPETYGGGAGPAGFRNGGGRTPRAGNVGGSHLGSDQSPDPRVPTLLRTSAAWCWRLLLVAAVAYLAFKVADALRLVVIPLIAAILATALLQPFTALLRRAGLPPLAATWCTVLAAIVVLGGIGTLIANGVQADYPRLAAEARITVREIQAFLAGPPFHFHGARVSELSRKLLTYLGQHKSLVVGTVVTGGRYFIEVLTGLILTAFITFFLLKDGRKIWSWLISGLRPRAHARAVQAGDAAWQALVGYIRGTTVVAAIHAIFIGLALWLLGVPLVVPLIMLVFIAAYIPLIGILVVGALAILITLATKGLIAAVILLAVFLAENQIESHLLQPLVVGRIIRLHPLAIIVVLAVGGIVAGIPGAIIAVPTAAVVTYAWPYLRGDHDDVPVEPPSGHPTDAKAR